MPNLRPFLSFCLLCAIACPSPRPEFAVTPADWSSSAAALPRCTTSGPDGALTLWELPDSLGQIRLPASFSASPSRAPHLRTWLAADSSSVEAWITPEPAASLMAGSEKPPTLEPQCRVTIGEHFAPVVPFHVRDSSGTYSRYAAMINTVPDYGIALNLTIESRTEVGRSILLGLVTDVQLRLRLLAK